MINVKLLYGRGELSVDLPETSDVTLIRKPRMPRLADPSLAVESTISNPTASAVLKNHAEKHSKLKASYPEYFLVFGRFLGGKTEVSWHENGTPNRSRLGSKHKHEKSTKR